MKSLSTKWPHRWCRKADWSLRIALDAAGGTGKSKLKTQSLPSSCDQPKMELQSKPLTRSYGAIGDAWWQNLYFQLSDYISELKGKKRHLSRPGHTHTNTHTHLVQQKGCRKKIDKILLTTTGRLIRSVLSMPPLPHSPHRGQPRGGQCRSPQTVCVKWQLVCVC